MKRKNLILAALPLLFAFTSCEQDIYNEIEFSVALDKSNTFKVGEPVKFDFKGNANYILMYTGDIGSEYQYRNRTEVAMEDLETCKLKMSVQARYGLADVLDFYVAPTTFEGLSGLNGTMDYQKMVAVQDSNYDGWTELDFTDGPSTKWTDYEYDGLAKYADGFTLAMHWNPQDFTQTQRHYWINLSLEVKFKGHDAVTITKDELGFTALSMADANQDNRYHINASDGSVIFNKPTTADIMLQGVGGNKLDYCLDYWVVSKPRKLNSISPDKPLDIKSIKDDIDSYSVTYDTPGEYTATFIATSANIYGSSQEVKSVTFTVTE